MSLLSAPFDPISEAALVTGVRALAHLTVDYMASSAR